MIPRERIGSSIEEVTVPAWTLFAHTPVEYVPGIDDLSDENLEKIIEVGSMSAPLALDILWRRKLQRQENIEAGRVRHVYRDPEGGGYWYVTQEEPKDYKKARKRLQNSGWIFTSGHSSDGVWIAKSVFSHEDEAATIFVYDYDGSLKEIIDILPNTCEHDWNYVPTGDDVCRKCRLVV